MKNNQITSQLKKSYLLVLIIGGIAMLLTSYFLIIGSFSDEYIQIPGLILGGIFGLAGFWCLLLIFFLERLEYKDGSLRIISLTGNLKKEISLTEIESYKEIEKENTHSSKWKDLTIYTKNSKHTISSYSHSNYDLLRRALTRGKKKNSYSEKMWHYKINRRYGVCFSIFGIILLSLLGGIYLEKDLSISKDSLAKIEGTVLKKIEIIKSDKRNRERSIEIELEEYPKFKFLIVDYGFNTTNVSELISNVKKGEKIELEISSDQLQKKLKRKVPMGFWDKGFNYRIINIYGINDEQNSYFNLDQFNRNRIEDRNSWAMYLLLGFSIFMLGYGIYILIHNKKTVSNKA